MIANIILDKAVIAYGQVNKTDTNLTNPIAYQNIPPKKVHLGDIDIAYKTFGKGKPLLLIAGSGAYMDMGGSHSIETIIGKPHCNHI